MPKIFLCDAQIKKLLVTFMFMIISSTIYRHKFFGFRKFFHKNLSPEVKWKKLTKKILCQKKMNWLLLYALKHALKGLHITFFDTMPQSRNIRASSQLTYLAIGLGCHKQI